MNLIAKRMLLVVFALLPSACAHYPQHYGYYPGDSAYSSNYTIMHRNNYGGRPEHYDNGYSTYYPSHHHRDQYNTQPRWENSYSGHQSHNQSLGYGRGSRQNDNDNHGQHFDGRNDG